jgi:hypothetical protein
MTPHGKIPILAIALMSFGGMAFANPTTSENSRSPIISSESDVNYLKNIDHQPQSPCEYRGTYLMVPADFRVGGTAASAHLPGGKPGVISVESDVNYRSLVQYRPQLRCEKGGKEIMSPPLPWDSSVPG